LEKSGTVNMSFGCLEIQWRSAVPQCFPVSRPKGNPAHLKPWVGVLSARSGVFGELNIASQICRPVIGKKNYTARNVRPTSIVKGYRWNAIYTYTDSFLYVAVYFPDVPRISAPFPYNTVLWIFLTDVPFCYLLRCELRVNRFKPVHQPGACIFSAVRDLGFKHTPAGLLRFNTVRNTFKYQYTFGDKLINLDRRRIIFHDPTCKFIFFPIPLRRRSALFISLFVLALAVLFYYRYVYSVCTAAEFNKNKINK